MLASDVVVRIRDIVNDPDKVRWTDDELLRYIGDGQMFIVIHRPDATAFSSVETLVKGSKQVLPIGSLRLLDVNNAVKADGSAGGSVTLLDRHELDSINANWQAAKPSLIVKNYIYDNRVPLEYRVYPPAIAGAKLDIITSYEPIDPTALTSSLSLTDVYRETLVSYGLFRCYCKDTEARSDLAKLHLTALSNALGIKLQKDAAYQPDLHSKGASPNPAALTGGGV